MTQRVARTRIWRVRALVAFFEYAAHNLLKTLEHDPEKWVPVFRKDHAQIKEIERDDDSKKSHAALDAWLRGQQVLKPGLGAGESGTRIHLVQPGDPREVLDGLDRTAAAIREMEACSGPDERGRTAQGSYAEPLGV